MRSAFIVTYLVRLPTTGLLARKNFRLARHSSRTEQIAEPDLINHNLPLLCPPLPLKHPNLDIYTVWL
jgi:hypothetical protein